jgi:hypothetical protein
MMIARGLVWSAALLALPSCRFDASGIAPFDLAAQDQPTVADRAPGAELATSDRPRSDVGVDLKVTPLPDFFLKDGPWPDVPGTCTGGWLKCSADGSQSLRCNPADGKYSPFQKCPMECNSSTGQCYSFEPSSHAGVLLPFGTEALTIDYDVVLDTTNAKATPSSFPIPVYCPPGPHCYLVVKSLELKAKGSLRATGQRTLVILAADSMNVAGMIDVSAAGQTPGPGGGAGGDRKTNGEAKLGGGCGGATGQIGLVSFGGGAGGSFGGGGGNGGDGPPGPQPCDSLCGDPSKPGIVVGGGGGGGGNGSVGTPVGGVGGGGGGGLQLTAMLEIKVSGTILAGGGGGSGGKTLSGSGGGGGSGGGVIIEAPNVEISGSVVANGGGGGGGTVSSFGTDGEKGTDGSASPTAAAPGGAGGEGVAKLTEGGPGGAGSFGVKIAGEDGGSGNMAAQAGGGGGGGAGSVCIRTLTGTPKISGKLNPATSAATNAVKLRSLPKT